MQPRSPLTPLLLPALLILQGAAQAQTPPTAPSAGSLLEEQRRQAPPALPAQTPPRLIEAPVRPTISMPEGTSVVVGAFRVTGALSFPAQELAAMLQPWVGKRLDLRALNEAAGVLTRHYQSNGHFLSYAYLPAQRVADGTIEIAVLEGRIESAQVVTAQDVRLRDEVVQAFTDRVVGATPAPQADVERQLLLLGEIPGVTARAAFTPGATSGGAEMLVSVAEEDPISLRAEFNNHGGISTGRYRAGLTLQLRDLFGWGDSTVARGYVSNRGSLVTGSLNSTVPLGGGGWRAGATLSRLRYQLAGTFRGVGGEGTADTVGLDLSYALVRSTDANLTARAGGEHKRLRDEQAAFPENGSTRNNEIAEFGLSGDFRDAGGGLGAGSLTYTVGNLRSGKAPQVFWRKLFVQGVRQFDLGRGLSVYARVAGQASGTPLDSSEKLGLGGIGAVRAYAPGESAVDHGAIGTLELRYGLDFLGGSIVGSLFHDYGGGVINKGRVGQPGNDPELNGSGLGLSWAGSGFGLNASLAWRGNRVPTADATDPKPRLYLQLFYTP
jgi:hemolysin activation/secretion protein